MAKVTIRGTGQLNGPVVINKTLELDSRQAREYVGAKRYEILVAALQIYYPGVKIDPKKLGVEVKY